VDAAGARERNALVIVSSVKEQNRQLSQEVLLLNQSLGWLHAGQGSVRALLRLLVRRVVERLTGRVDGMRGGRREEGRRRRKRGDEEGGGREGRWEGLEELVSVYEGEKEGLVVGA